MGIKNRFKRSVRLDILESQGYDNIKIVQRWPFSLQLLVQFIHKYTDLSVKKNPGLRFTNIFLQSSIAEVKKCFKSTHWQWYIKQISILISGVFFFEKDTLQENVFLLKQKKFGLFFSYSVFLLKTVCTNLIAKVKFLGVFLYHFTYYMAA